MNQLVKKGIILTIALVVVIQVVQQAKRVGLPAKRDLGISIPENDHLAPKAAWLMSFPLSGSDYVIDVIHRLSEKATGTNYGNVMEEHDGVQVRNLYQSLPVFTGRDRGPFLFVDHMVMPFSYIPISTYCTGYCWDCFPGRFAGITRDQFAKGCVTSLKFTPSPRNNGDNAFGTTEEVQYAGELIEKAAIVVRNPFVVIEERFLYSSFTYATAKEWIPRFEPNARGFHDFCNEAEVKYALEEKKWFSDAVFESSRGKLCHIEFYKLIQWYNYAFDTLALKGLTPKLIYYEDLANSDTFAEAALDLLSFYELTPIVPVSTNKPPLTSQSPTNYMTQEEKTDLIQFIRLFANENTLSALDPYFKNL